MLATGAFSPLTGFMGEADYVRARDEMRLASAIAVVDSDHAGRR